MVLTRTESSQRRIWIAVLVTLMVASVIVAMSPTAEADARPRDGATFQLTLLHNNDGESQLLADGDFGGIARFATLAKQLHAAARGQTPGEPPRNEWALSRQGVVMVTSGDNFLAGPEWNASLEKGVPFYDSIALRSLPYDAFVLGNHDFDFGPDVTADFIDGFFPPPPPRVPRGAILQAVQSLFRRVANPSGDVVFLSANLDFSGEPRLAELERKRRIADSTVVVTGGHQIGIIGATTPNLPFISSPRNVKVDPNVVEIVQAEIDKMERRRIDIIVFVSHLQSIQEDVALIGQLHGVDVAVAGGGDELLASPDDLLVPGDEGSVFDNYPIYATNADGQQVPVVTTSGDYKYLGQLVVNFDRDGNVVSVDDAMSGPKRVSGVAPDGVADDPFMVENVVEPIEEFVSGLASNVIATTEVQLDGRRSPGVRSQETNLGDLMADSMRWQAAQLAGAFGTPVPDVGIQNGGGIRNNDLRPDTVPGPFTELDTFDIAPFPNFVVVFPEIPRDQFKAILENAYSRVETSSGRFAQLSGVTVEVDLAQQARDPDDPVGTPGARVRSAILDDGTVLVADGAVVPGPAISIATIDFLARGGDQYPYDGAPFVVLGVSYQQALANYVKVGLGGLISAADYPEVPLNGGSRIIITNRP